VSAARRRTWLAVTALVLVCACSRGAEPGPATAPSAPPGDWFVDRARESGLDFVHVNGMSGRFYMPEVLAPGVALFDYDQASDFAINLVQ